MNRVYNFSAGPSVLPEEVLEIARDELLNWHGSGMSVMEMSHRSRWFEEIIRQTEADLRQLMNIPSKYKVLFLQGGTFTQFAMVPLNLMKKGKADYVNTGTLTQKAIGEARKFCKVNIVASSEKESFACIPALDPKTFSRDADYFYITANNTIHGTRYTTLPDTGRVPLVSDISSSILSEVYDVSKFGLLFAGAQKNMGPAGVTVVIIREDLITDTSPEVPTMLQYKVHAENESMYNTPPCYSIYMCGLVYQWLKKLGGVPVMQKMNEEKAAILYDFLDNSSMFRGTVMKKDRSLMNIPFTTGNKELDAKFVREAQAKGLVNLKGHRIVGGMRASLYNAMPLQGVQALVSFMKDFEAANK
ncbi:MAG: 3-phosphoserine/phosphohydroxythreonine transaminase [Thermoclostridium sp.]|nr:3-phosphoserine/phosphohydroxythreonine transaminase [Thermoclostridium sp.]